MLHSEKGPLWVTATFSILDAASDSTTNGLDGVGGAWGNLQPVLQARHFDRHIPRSQVKLTFERRSAVVGH
jgi:hypothetical protein